MPPSGQPTGIIFDAPSVWSLAIYRVSAMLQCVLPSLQSRHCDAAGAVNRRSRKLLKTVMDMGSI
jgi:hypothetical protein